MRKVRVRWQTYSKEVCCPERTENDIPVYGNLTVTPAEMMKMAEKGIPISSQNKSIQMTPEDGEKTPSWTLPLDRIRGVDPAQMWEESQIIKERARMAHINDRKKFGDGELIKRK